MGDGGWEGHQSSVSPAPTAGCPRGRGELPSPIPHLPSPSKGANVRARSFIRALPGILAPVLFTVLVVALGLRLLNATPAYLVLLRDGPPPPPNILDERLSYPTIEAAEQDLGLRVRTPSYFPSYLVWPPASVRGQRQPAKVVSLLIRSADGQQALQIRQLFWPGDELPFPVPEPAQVVETREVRVDRMPGRLLLGSGQGNTPVNQIRWRMGSVHFVITGVTPPEELLRIAESMQ